VSENELLQQEINMLKSNTTTNFDQQIIQLRKKNNLLQKEFNELESKAIDDQQELLALKNRIKELELSLLKKNQEKSD